MQAGKHRDDHGVDPAQQMLLGDPIFKPELVEQCPLIRRLSSHHRCLPL